MGFSGGYSRFRAKGTVFIVPLNSIRCNNDDKIISPKNVMYKDVHTSVGYDNKNMANRFSKNFKYIAWHEKMPMT